MHPSGKEKAEHFTYIFSYSSSSEEKKGRTGFIWIRMIIIHIRIYKMHIWGDNIFSQESDIFGIPTKICDQKNRCIHLIP